MDNWLVRELCRKILYHQNEKEFRKFNLLPAIPIQNR